jgi:hypothetical protein
LLERLVSSGMGRVRVRALGGDRSGEVRLGRFLHNRRVTPKRMVAAAHARTLQQVAGRHILVIQDTTSVRDASNTTKHSLHLHAGIAVDAENGGLIGLTDATFLRRRGGARARKGVRPFAQKQSRRWLDVTKRAQSLLQAGAASVTVVADRESDVYEEFALRPEGVDVVIRAQQDRTLSDGGLLSRCLDDVAELGRETIDLPAGPGRRARRAILALRARCVRIKAPKRAVSPKTPADVAVWFLEAREIDAPAGCEPLHWLLLTTCPAPDLASARRILAIYRERWIIEQLFRTMKTKGFDIEASQVTEGGAFENLATATLIAAIQVLQMTRERDGARKQPLADAFDLADHAAMAAICRTLEGKTDRQRNPHSPDSLAWATWICARLGGWTGYYGKPGPIVIHNGLIQLNTLIQGWTIRQHV